MGVNETHLLVFAQHLSILTKAVDQIAGIVRREFDVYVAGFGTRQKQQLIDDLAQTRQFLELDVDRFLVRRTEIAIHQQLFRL